MRITASTCIYNSFLFFFFLFFVGFLFLFFLRKSYLWSSPVMITCKSGKAKGFMLKVSVIKDFGPLNFSAISLSVVPVWAMMAEVVPVYAVVWTIPHCDLCSSLKEKLETEEEEKVIVKESLPQKMTCRYKTNKEKSYLTDMPLPFCPSPFKNNLTGLLKFLRHMHQHF